MRYSAREGRWYGKRECPRLPDPYSPNSSGFSERNQQHVKELPGGMIRIDVGARLP